MREGLVLLAVLLCSACTAPATTSDAEQPAPGPELAASVVQLRHEENSTTLHVRIINAGDDPVQLTRAGLAGPSLHSAPTPPVVPETARVAPGEFMTAPGVFDPPDCAREGDPAVATALLDDGTELEVPVDTEGQLVVDRIVSRLCLVERVAAAVDLRLLTDWQRTTVDGEPVLSGTLAVDRLVGGSGADVRVTQLLGSVLLNLDAAPGALPVDVSDEPVRVPVTLSATGRCDAHALASSQQTFQLSTYVRVDGGPEQRIITVPDRPTQRRSQQVIRIACGLVG